MNAIILAAGFGTRLKPWTDTNPKALVPVEGIPMLERVITLLREQGFNSIAVNIHHFGEKIVEFLENKKYDTPILISDERDGILDTGGGVAQAYTLFGECGDVLVHNVDIISNADLASLSSFHKSEGNDITLLVSNRDSSRKFVFDSGMNLKGWHSIKEDRFRPENLIVRSEDFEYSFSGIYTVGEKAVKEMKEIMKKEKYSIIDYLLHPARKSKVRGAYQENLILLDIGKPATLSQASDILNKINA